MCHGLFRSCTMTTTLPLAFRAMPITQSVGKPAAVKEAMPPLPKPLSSSPGPAASPAKRTRITRSPLPASPSASSPPSGSSNV